MSRKHESALLANHMSHEVEFRLGSKGGDVPLL